MKEFIEKLKAAIMAESYEDGTKEMAYRSVISVKSALEAIDGVAAEQPEKPTGLYEEVQGWLKATGCIPDGTSWYYELLGMVDRFEKFGTCWPDEKLAAEQEERHEAN